MKTTCIVCKRPMETTQPNQLAICSNTCAKEYNNIRFVKAFSGNKSSS